MNPPQINIAGHLAIGQCPVEMFRASFRHAQVADAVKILVLNGRFPSPPRFILFLGNDVVHDFLPCPRGQLGISAVGRMEQWWANCGEEEEVLAVFQLFRYEDGTEIQGDHTILRGQEREADAQKCIQEMKVRHSMTRQQAIDIMRLIICSEKERKEMEDEIDQEYPNYQFPPQPNSTDEYDVYQARLKVLAGLQPTTVELLKIANGIDDPQKRHKVEREAVQAYFAELAHYFTEDEIAAWQRTNPLRTGWWCTFADVFRQPRRWVDGVNHELVLNWLRRKYNLLTAEELSGEIFKSTLVRLSPEVLKKRRERLGLTTKRPPGPPPTPSCQ